jgi:hypothetical protein
MPMNISIAVAIAAMAAGLLLPDVASAQQWKVYQEEGVSLGYRNAADTESLLSIDCSAKASDVVVPVPPGVKRPPQAPGLRVQEGNSSRTIALSVEVCGGELTCTDRPAGDVSTYFAKATNKELALRLADQASAISIDAPGAHVSALADRRVFAQFAKLCRDQK